jgi:tRNA U34 2-thiouridine synthase MnmA/TrmU
VRKIKIGVQIKIDRSEKNMTKAISLFSGGLDSTIATQLILDQGIKVIGLNFKTPFTESCWALKMADKLEIELRVIETDEEYMKIVKEPEHGYGKNMNPCIDCKIFMLKKAKELMNKEKAEFVFTGEVLGERLMSQRKRQLELTERKSGLKGLLLRPLSAKLLDPTIPEKTGIVDREKLLALRGKRREIQIKLINEFGIKEYATPAGGCRLTDPQFSKRLKEGLGHGEDDEIEIELLKYGRHFRLFSGKKVVVGRNKEENETISDLARADDLLFEVIGFSGPITLLKGPRLKDSGNEKDAEIAASLCARYSDCKSDRVEVRMGWKGKWEKSIWVEPAKEKFIRKSRVG